MPSSPVESAVLVAPQLTTQTFWDWHARLLARLRAQHEPLSRVRFNGRLQCP
jgi:hypothetical protein